MKPRHIFVSAVSKELGSYRQAIEATLRSQGYHTVEQTTFVLTAESIDGLLRDHVSRCDAVICLIGTRYGAEPGSPPPGYERHSYTQFEYLLAKELKLPVYLLLTDEASPPPPDPGHLAEPEPEELAKLQVRYRARVTQDRDWRSFRSLDELKHQVLLLRYPWTPATGHAAADEAKARSRRHAQGYLAEAFDRDPTELPGFVNNYLEGRYAEAQRSAIAAAQASAELADADPRDAARAYWLAGLAAMRQQASSRQASRHFKKAAALAEQADSAKLRARALAGLGGVCFASKDLRRAVDTLHEAVELAEKAFGPRHAATLAASTDLAAACTEAGRPRQAEALLERVYDIREAELGPEHPRTINTGNALACCYKALGQSHDAEEVFRELLGVAKSTYGEEHPIALRQLFNLAHHRLDRDDPDTAAVNFRQLLRLHDRVYGRGHVKTASVLNSLAWVLHLLGRDREALPFAEDAMAALREVNPDHCDVLSCRHTVAMVQAGLGNAIEAVRQLENLLPDQERVLGPQHADTVTTRTDLDRLKAGAGPAGAPRPVDRGASPCTGPPIVGPESLREFVDAGGEKPIAGHGPA